MISIKTENLSKRYIIGHRKEERYTALRDVLMHGLRSAGQRIRHPLSPNKEIIASEELWAVRDINLEIKQGDRVGIIGRNGAGKSTLLKLLSRITEPTTGRFTLHGRVASMLEVGTGFHPELSGRENIFLNGAILGMSRAEIKGKFDAIVDFSEIEKFLDTPVKRYSSGMYVRLAFAVAAHLEPEILIVDEVLAVGDAQFQKKCLGIMGEAGKEGRTVIFVSHQMGSIAQLCTNAVMLDKGEIKHEGPVADVIQTYLNGDINQQSTFVASGPRGHQPIAITNATIKDRQANVRSHFTHNEPITITIQCQINLKVTGAEIRLVVRDSIRNVFTTDTQLMATVFTQAQNVLATVVIPAGVLRPGDYFLSLASYLPNVEIYDSLADVFSIKIVDGGSKYAASEGVDYGCVFVDCDWSVESI
jgi:lipopolysaccharide transport system ATP-binding protein